MSRTKPTREVKLESGEYWADVSGTTSGTAKIDGAENDKGQVYFAGNVFELRSTGKDRGMPIFRGAINSDTGALDKDSIEGLKSYVMSSDASLKGCTHYPSFEPERKK
jgi:hypothetical protein